MIWIAAGCALVTVVGLVWLAGWLFSCAAVDDSYADWCSMWEDFCD